MWPIIMHKDLLAKIDFSQIFMSFLETTLKQHYVRYDHHLNQHYNFHAFFLLTKLWNFLAPLIY